LSGEVDNRTDGVSVIVECDLRTVDRFSNDIIKNAPAASSIKSIELYPRLIEGYTSFRITESKSVDNLITEISPDIAVCPDCLIDLVSDPERYDYPFINCTNCGPRFSIIEGLPYDRDLTSMKDFIMCGKCKNEYNDIKDRRFHAQPIACTKCGPRYHYTGSYKDTTEIRDIIDEVVAMISAGKIVALKGLGGYFLACDALQNDAVIRLRIKKNRDQKPFAVMFRDASAVREYCYADRKEMTELSSWRRPIVLLRQKKSLAGSVSNGLKTTGAMLPYMPIHYLLFRNLRTPAVVMTSGNISDEPIITDDNVAGERLTGVADSVISYDRKIINRVDDSVIRFINKKESLIRRSRGFVPRPVDLRFDVEGILALGAEEKNTFTIGKNKQAVMSQYIGDLKNQPAFDFLGEAIKRFSDLYKFKPEIIACDIHPDYYSTVYGLDLGRRYSLPVISVQHHHAHIASCMAEYGLDEKVIGISLDGTGYGDDGKIWGGEFLIADLEHYERFTHFDYVPMPGGEKAIKEPWRMAFSYLFKYFGDNFDYESIPGFRSVDPSSMALLREMIINRINSPESSGAGRLFDAVSALTGICPYASFESEPPMRLESAINTVTDLHYPYSIGDQVVFADTLKALTEDLNHVSHSIISARFHNTVAMVILEVAERIRTKHDLNKVVLSGGVFQNKYLTEKAYGLLERNKFEVFTNHAVPANDGGISLGQLVIASKRNKNVSQYTSQNNIY
jgi:hydrogenase maturation protein HypF